jgi:hypothetical protein
VARLTHKILSALGLGDRRRTHDAAIDLSASLTPWARIAPSMLRYERNDCRSFEKERASI